MDKDEITWNDCHVSYGIHEIGCPHRPWARDIEFKKYWSEKMRVQRRIEKYQAMVSGTNKQKPE